MPSAPPKPAGPPLARCPQCDADLAEDRWAATGRCPRCRLPCDESTLVITGAATTSGEFLALVVGWTTVGLLCISFVPGPILAVVGVAMALHLGVWLLLGDGRAARRLVINDTGVALLRGGRRIEPLRWHLFDEARIDLLAEGDGHDPFHRLLPRWRLTLVNAYKPTISAYLHRRGTDAPIFSEAIVFTFQAPAELVETLRGRLARSIQIASRGYRALNLKKMHLIAPDPAEVLRLRECPCCACDLRGLPRDGKCPVCGRAHSGDMFTLPGRVVTRRPAAVMVPAFAIVLGVVYLLGGHARPGMALFAFGAVTAGLCLAMKLMFDRESRRSVIVARNGLEIWTGGDAPQAYDWWQLPEHRAVQVDFGRWRIAFWDHTKSSIAFSEFLFTWHAFPPGRPVIDVVIRGDEQTGRMICDEIERRLAGTARSAGERVSRRSVVQAPGHL